jgi:hypothetical protein
LADVSSVGCLLQDLQLATTNPFVCHKQAKLSYDAAVLLPALLTSLGLVAAGPGYYGMNIIGIVWVQVRRRHPVPFLVC